MAEKQVDGRWAFVELEDVGYTVHALSAKFAQRDPEIRVEDGVCRVFASGEHEQGEQVGPDFDNLDAAKVFYLLTFGGA